MSKPKTFRVTITGRVTPDVAAAVGELTDRQFKGKASLALEAILKRGINPFRELNTFTTDELKRISVVINGELSMRERQPPEAKTA